MKRLKHKILMPTLATVSTLAIVAPLTISISSKVITTNTNNSSVVNSINYNTITFHGDTDTSSAAEWTVTLAGPNKVKAEVGNPFGSVQRPKAVHSLNWKFLGWSLTHKTTYTESDILSDSTPIPAKGTTWNLYPVFETPALLSNCLCISAIEDTTVTIKFPADESSSNRHIDMSYSTDFGTTWKTIDHATTVDTKTLSIAAGSCLYLKGDNASGLSYGDENEEFLNITFSNSVNLFGNVMGLVNNGSREKQKTKCVPNAYCFYHLFEGANKIEYVADNFFPCEKYEDNEYATLKAHCYEGAFKNCSGMLHAPRLFATNNAVLGDASNDTTNCYKEIFYGCSNIDFVRTRYTGTYTDASSQFENWVYNINSKGTFIYDGDDSATSFGFGANWAKSKCPEDGEDSITITTPTIDPSGGYTAGHEFQFSAEVTKGGSSSGVYQTVYWITSNEAIATIDHSTGILTGSTTLTEATNVYVTCFSAANLNAAKTIQVKIYPLATANCTSIINESTTASDVSWTYVGTPRDGVYPNFKYSFDGTTWLEWSKDISINIPAKSKIYVKGNNPKGLSNGSANSYTQFVSQSGTFSLGGTVVGLINDGAPLSGSEVIPCDYCFTRLFAESNVLSVPAGYLPYTSGQLTNYCYSYMFYKCPELTTVEDSSTTKFLPAEALTQSGGSEAKGCYSYMFYQSDKLETMFTLPATTLSESCYSGMFYRCSSIKTAPALPATDAKDSCYSQMFQECSSLNNIGTISLTSTASSCCYQMFAGVSYAYDHKSTSKGSGYTLLWALPSSIATNATYLFFWKSNTQWETPTSGTYYILNGQ